MIGIRPFVPRAGTGSALLLAATTLVLLSVWPDRAEAANTSWYPLATVRATGLALWAWVLGTMHEDRHAEPAPASLLRLALGALLTAPIEAFAHAASAPTTPLAWSLAAPLALAWALYGAGWLLASVVRRLRSTVVLPPLAIAVAVGLVFLDVRLGLGWWTPWTLSRTPSIGAAALSLLVGGITWVGAVREARARPQGTTS